MLEDEPIAKKPFEYPDLGEGSIHGDDCHGDLASAEGYHDPFDAFPELNEYLEESERKQQ